MGDKEVIQSYWHHGRKVYVRRHLRGLHREHCLCHICIRFHPGGDPRLNCPIAQAVYENCTKYDLVTPVWECPDWRPILTGDV